MKNIKFKAWDGGNFLPLEDDGDYYFRLEPELCLYDKHGKVKGVIILQYTGIEDENGKKICEGDILKSHLTGMPVPVVYDIDYAQFMYGGLSFERSKLNSKLRVIGNIYENPELL